MIRRLIFISIFFLLFDLGCAFSNENACKIEEGFFLGHEALFLENSLIRVTVLPKLGARIAEYFYKPASHNQFYLNPNNIRAVGGGALPEGSGAYIPFGGYEDNLCDGHGPFFLYPYQVQIGKGEKGGISILVWADLPDLRVERKMTIWPRSSLLRVDVKAISKGKKKVSIRAHPEIVCGGDHKNDIFFYPSPEGIKIIENKVGNFWLEPNINWWGVRDTEKCEILLNSFESESVEKIYRWYGSDRVTMELFSQPAKVSRLVLKYGILEGTAQPIRISKLAVAADFPYKKILPEKDVPWRISLLSFSENFHFIKIELRLKKKEKILKREVLVKDSIGGQSNLDGKWDLSALSDGDYILECEIFNRTGKPLALSRAEVQVVGKMGEEIRTKFRKLDYWLTELEKKKEKSEREMMELSRVRWNKEDAQKVFKNHEFSKSITIVEETIRRIKKILRKD